MCFGFFLFRAMFYFWSDLSLCEVTMNRTACMLSLCTSQYAANNLEEKIYI